MEEGSGVDGTNKGVEADHVEATVENKEGQG